MMGPWMPDPHHSAAVQPSEDREQYFDAVQAAREAESKAKAENADWWSHLRERIQQRSQEVGNG